MFRLPRFMLLTDRSERRRQFNAAFTNNSLVVINLQEKAMPKHKHKIILMAAAVLLLGMPPRSHAAENNVMSVEGVMPASTYIPSAPPISAPAPTQASAPVPANVSQVPPDNSPSPLQVPPPAPIYVAPQPAQVVLPAAPPQFVYVPELGYYVAMGLPYDMIYDGRAYYFHNNGYWYRTSYYGDPWTYVAARALPPILIRFNVNEAHRYRDVEFKRYEREKGHYRGRLHRPDVRRGEKREERR